MKARTLTSPSQMTVAQIEAEMRALLDRQHAIGQHECRRDVCDGQPHTGFPFLHALKAVVPPGPLEEARLFDDGYRERAHLVHLSRKLAEATAKVEQGESQFLTVSMPPRSGKSHMTSVFFPTWLLHKHPDWKIGLISHSPILASQWGLAVRRIIEKHPDEHGVRIAPDAGAVSNWQTTKGGHVFSRSAPGQSITGMGFKVLLIDDPVKDFAAAHSEGERERIWDWWLANAFTRLEFPALVVIVGTRWHEDDFIGRILAPGNADGLNWQSVTFPAIAEEHDVLGREPGQPLYSPVVADQTEEEAIQYWRTFQRAVGSYAWEALYQQRPSPPEGAIFNVNWWRYWTTDPTLATEDGRVRHVTAEELSAGTWVDSWDAAFKGTEDSDFVVGQRWVRVGGNRFLVDQKRGRWTFTQTLAEMRQWGSGGGPYGDRVYQRLIEDAANGPAIIDTLREEIAGIKPVRPNGSKDARARAVSPEVESGNVYLPHPAERPFVTDLLSELRAFPNAANDDQVDALTQALFGLRESGSSRITNPGSRSAGLPSSASRMVSAARTGVRRSAGG